MQGGTGQIGFLFEELVGQTLGQLAEPMTRLGWKFSLQTEQEIRDRFGEQSLNGVDHMLEVDMGSEGVVVFLLQEKWKIMTNQREVSQFLDCCSRILSRIRPDERGTVYRLWVTRSQPSANGEKSLNEGGAYVVQCMTSQPILAQITGQFICELLGKREWCAPMIAAMPSLLTTTPPIEPVVLDNSKTAPAPVFTYKTQVTVQKSDYYLPPI
jgi:hypothetical protein